MSERSKNYLIKYFRGDRNPLNILRRNQEDINDLWRREQSISSLDDFVNEGFGDVDYITNNNTIISGLGYTLKFEEGDLGCELPANTTLYCGVSHIGAGSFLVSEVPIVVPKAGTLKRVDMYYINFGTLSSGEDASIEVWKNSITAIATWDSDCGFDEAIKHHAITGLSATLAENDTLSIKITTPNWTSSLIVGAFVSAILYIE